MTSDWLKQRQPLRGSLHRPGTDGFSCQLQIRKQELKLGDRFQALHSQLTNLLPWAAAHSKPTETDKMWALLTDGLRPAGMQMHIWSAASRSGEVMSCPGHCPDVQLPGCRLHHVTRSWPLRRDSAQHLARRAAFLTRSLALLPVTETERCRMTLNVDKVLNNGLNV